ncbi:MAG: hypothetical protein GF370_03845 [Candidatus Nealsonbacteria bacterium]|nr:hypothetical protein [Candidatus Nealsonbacteria bacterium]
MSNVLFYGELKERRENLERFYRLMVDKEIELLELKAKVKKLKSKIEEREN